MAARPQIDSGHREELPGLKDKSARMGLELLDEYDLFVGAKLRELREERGALAEDLADYMLTSRQQYYRYETGKNRIPIARVILAAELLKVPLTAFNPPAEINNEIRRKIGACVKSRSSTAI